MKDVFKKTLVVCAAISGFGGSAYLGDSVLTSYIKSKQVAEQVMSASEGGESEVSKPLAAVDVPKPKANFSFSFGR